MAEKQETSSPFSLPQSSSSERFPGVRTAVIQQMLAASDEMDVEKSLTFCTDDVLYKFGNLPTISGKQGIKEMSASFLSNFKSLKHDIKRVWETGETVIVAMEVHYTLANSKVLTLPCCNIFQMRGEKVQEIQVYMDISPVFS